MRLLWSKVGRLLQLGDVSQSHHTAADLATHFTSKVDKVRQATATANAPVINQRQSSTFDVFQPVTTDEVLKLLSKAPTKHCQLDPILAALCNASFQSGRLRVRETCLGH